MATLRKLVSDVRSVHKILSTDALITDRAIASEIRNNANLLVKRETILELTTRFLLSNLTKGMPVRRESFNNFDLLSKNIYAIYTEINYELFFILHLLRHDYFYKNKITKY
jgi:hypothetical protein